MIRQNKTSAMKGYIHVYTGDGKGKTTAALGMALRAAGAGMKVFIGQFVKGMHYHELDVIERIPEITLRQYGLDCFIVNEPAEKDIEAAQKGFEEIKGIVQAGEHHMVVFDEVNIALYYKLISPEDLMHLIKNRPPHVEVVLTGRYAPQEILDMADLVTEMKEVRHYYRNGVEARKGFEY
jgi:cob(I)alamin adenosyltransferase